MSRYRFYTPTIRPLKNIVIGDFRRPTSIDKIITLSGDRAEQRSQATVLRAANIPVFYVGEILAIANADYTYTLTVIWNHRPKGWWRYRKQLIDHRICDDTRFEEQLNQR